MPVINEMSVILNEVPVILNEVKDLFRVDAAMESERSSLVK
jgi:hypothetical protein